MNHCDVIHSRNHVIHERISSQCISMNESHHSFCIDLYRGASQWNTSHRWLIAMRIAVLQWMNHSIAMCNHMASYHGRIAMRCIYMSSLQCVSWYGNAWITSQCIAMNHITSQCIAMNHITSQCITAHHSTARHITAQHSTAQHSTLFRCVSCLGLAQVCQMWVVWLIEAYDSLSHMRYVRHNMTHMTHSDTTWLTWLNESYDLLRHNTHMTHSDTTWLTW